MGEDDNCKFRLERVDGFCPICAYNMSGIFPIVDEGLVQWLKLSAWKVEDFGFEPHFGIQVSSPLTRRDSIL